ncbi:MAG TPA: peptidoglycan-binding domain-containing protein [Anaerohalosphaeraceae bacterium]|nr:peptidoglycan-binding domain-containing protein [Anaerohalosphaeraceae bacterium]
MATLLVPSNKKAKMYWVVMGVELVVILALGYGFLSKGKQLSTKDDQITELEKGREILVGQLQDLQKNTVSAENYARLTTAVQSLKTAAISSGQMSIAQAAGPEQICAAVRQILQKPQTAVTTTASQPSSASEIDFHITVVENEIARLGVIDTTKPDKKYDLAVFYMQKVLDGIGYQLGGAVTGTSQAVMKFQADNQLKADGKIGVKTWEKVRQLWNAKKPKA